MGQDVRHDVTRMGQGGNSGSVERTWAMIRAVVLDIGSVLEVIDDSVFPEPFELRHGLTPGAVAAACDWPGDPVVGEMTQDDIRAHWQRGLGLTDAQTDELVADQ